MNKLARLLKYKIIFLHFLNTLLCFSQQEKSSFNDLTIQGIPFNKKVNTLFLDSIGFLWIGTNTGLYRYDGYNLTEYQNNVFDPSSLTNNSINSIIEDNNKNLWIGSESFLIYFDRNQDKFKGYYRNNTSVVLRKTSEGKILANVRNTGLIFIEPDKLIENIKFDSQINYENIKSLLKFDKKINTIVEDSFKRYWAGTSKGIFFITKKDKFIQTNFKEEVMAMNTLSNNQIAVATNNGFYILQYNKTDTNLEILETYPNFMSSLDTQGNVSSMILGANKHELWIGTTDGLIKAVRNNNKYHFYLFSNDSSNKNILSNQISSTVIDKYGNFWVGSSKGVTKQIARTALFDFNNLGSFLNFKNATINSLLYLSGNDNFIGTSQGLFKYNSKTNTFKKIEIVSDSKIDIINKLYYNYTKTELLICTNTSIYQSIDFKNNSNKLTLKKIKAYNKQITDVAIINNKEIWVGLWDGGIDIINIENPLSKFKKNIVSRLANSHISVLLFTKDFNLWIGTRGESIFKVDLNNESFEQYIPNKEGLTSKAILSIYEDRKNNIWLGTRGGGLNLYHKKANTFTNFNSVKGLIPKTIASIKEDQNGTIWMSTQDGLARLDVLKKKFTPFGIEDGILDVEFVFNTSSSNRGNNILYFATTNGFYTVHPNLFKQKLKVPSTVITSFSTLSAENKNQPNAELNNFNKTNYNSNEPIVLPYNKNNIAINFSSLDLTSPRKNEYSYILEGLNSYWVYTNASNRNANYNNLPPGSYTFKVKSSNSDGIWNETPTTLKFTITPPFWKSTFAYFVYWIIILALIYFGYILIKRWYNLKNNLVKETISREKDNEFNNMKMVFFTDISHELRTPLSLILGTIEKVINDKKFTLSPLTSQRIYNNTLRMLRLINQIMDIRKFDEGKLKLTISKNNIVKDISIIKNSFNDFAKIYEIKYEFISSESEIKGWYDVDILEKILFNILSNAFKFTQKNGIITVHLALAIPEDLDPLILDIRENKFIKCSVRDNGNGIPEKDLEHIFDRYYQSTKNHSNHIPGTGIGMELVHKLIERHHGYIMVESKENVYTEFTFYLPINKNRFLKSERINSSMPLNKSFIQNSEFQVIEEVSSEFDTKIYSKNNSNPKILLVEDNIEVRTMLKEELIDDYNIIEASNGHEGYEMIVKEKPFLIISDILMPVEDGISMLKRVKENKEINTIPIFMLTAKTSAESKIDCLSLGADDYIEKPFSLEFVKWKIKNIILSRKELKERYSKVITSEPSEIEIDSNDEKFIKKLIKIIENSMDDNLLSVEYLASEIGMSRANLYRKVQAIINDTPVNFIKTIRLKRAAQLLKKNELYLSEIAYMTGFNNQKYFGKCFQKEFKMSPTEYIKKFADEKDTNSIDFS